MNKKIFLSLFISLIVLSGTYAQSDSTTTGTTDISDSLLNKILGETALELKQRKQQFFTESIRKAELEREINLLKANDRLKRDELQARINSELHQHIQDVFIERGIEILSPHYRAMRDGNMTTTPATYLPDNNEAPHFRVKTDSTSTLPEVNILLKN